MAICTDCDQEMRTAASCTADALLIRDERFERRRATRRDCGRDGRCGDCGTEPGGHHHLGCDLEPCPRCRGQLISCGCSWVDDDTSSLLAVRGDHVVSGGLAGLALPPGRFPFDHPASPVPASGAASASAS